jgi:NADH dehydrogenase FAD-containing subunit
LLPRRRKQPAMFIRQPAADATALHAHVIDKLEHAELEENAAVRRELLTFVVAGDGLRRILL